MITPRPRIEITVVDVKGSAPREPGSAMTWFPDARTDSTIGGGNLEQKCLDEAQRLWNDPQRQTAFLEFPLSEKLGQCCGGYVRVFLNKILPPHEVLICGAGHVSTALANLLAETPLKVTIVDTREDWATRERFSPRVNVMIDQPEALIREWSDRAERTYLLIMTHNHPLDLALCQLALRFPFLWIGLIGSRTKWLRFRQRLASKGFQSEELNRITNPIGNPALGKSPQEIAIGVSAQLLALYHGSKIESVPIDQERPSGVRAALILAGGASRRMGQWKGSLDFHGVPMMAAHFDAAREAGAEFWKAVYPQVYQSEAERLIAPPHRLMNENPDLPMFASLQLGVRALIQMQINLSSILITPVDTPPLDADLIAALWDRHEATDAWVTRPSVSDIATGEIRFGHPAILDQRLFAPILAADPAIARLDFLIRDLPGEFKATLELSNAAALANLNTPEDYASVIG